jgi:S-adenosylmethionine:tRNA ribosyltransferase-isomerase
MKAASSDFFDYHLPPHLVAQEPPARRDQSRLLVVRRASGSIEHHVFGELPGLLSAGDLVVLNDTKVVNARLLGRRARTGGKWEGLFLQVQADGSWELMCQTRGQLHEGECIHLEPGPLALELVQRTEAGHWLARPSESGNPFDILERYGHVPLPPYIRKGKPGLADRQRYQTVYARRAGAVAAPTAGLHFTPEVFERLRQRNIDTAFVTLHVGLGTFQPIQAADWRRHRMHREWGELPAATADALRACRQRGGCVVAVGTTTVRLLETVADSGPLRSWSGQTDLFIFPPFRFQVIDALVTNFHLPRSTLLLLVGAFAGTDLLRQAYQAAIDADYRFYSYGDAMLIL